MQIATTIDDINHFLQKTRNQNKIIGFVPTMGALHTGHISLIKKDKQECDLVVCSIFVNPTQFNNPNDLKNYPITIEDDKKMLKNVSCDILFLPVVKTIYPSQAHSISYELKGLDSKFEGEKRPGHFDGVCTVVHRFFEIIKPNKSYFGQKDFQQLSIIKHLVKLLNLKIDIIECPIIRESNGLAKSSRNVLLSQKAKNDAALIFKSLKNAKLMYSKTKNETVISETIKQLKKIPNSKIDYVSIADPITLEEMKSGYNNHNLVMLVAIEIENIRLIDNIMLKD
jgi:pantoate--beta-alanine ligase